MKFFFYKLVKIEKLFGNFVFKKIVGGIILKIWFIDEIKMNCLVI